MTIIRRLLSSLIIVSFLTTTIMPVRTYAASPAVLGLPSPGMMVNLSPAYASMLMKGVRVHPENPLLFDFIIDTGHFLKTIDHRPETKDLKGTNTLGNQIVRQIILPEIEKEINQGKNFAPLRQIFYSLVLASWYKKNLKQALLNQVYSDKNKINGVNVDDKQIGQKIYQQYLAAYKKGVFNYIKEDVGQLNKQPLPRKYFSGGLKWRVNVAVYDTLSNPATMSPDGMNFMVPTAMGKAGPDGAMTIEAAAAPFLSLAGRQIGNVAERIAANDHLTPQEASGLTVILEDLTKQLRLITWQPTTETTERNRAQALLKSAHGLMSQIPRPEVPAIQERWAQSEADRFFEEKELADSDIFILAASLDAPDTLYNLERAGGSAKARARAMILSKQVNVFVNALPPSEFKPLVKVKIAELAIAKASLIKPDAAMLTKMDDYESEFTIAARLDALFSSINKDAKFLEGRLLRQEKTRSWVYVLDGVHIFELFSTSDHAKINSSVLTLDKENELENLKIKIGTNDYLVLPDGRLEPDAAMTKDAAMAAEGEKPTIIVMNDVGRAKSAYIMILGEKYNLVFARNQNEVMHIIQNQPSVRLVLSDDSNSLGIGHTFQTEFPQIPVISIVSSSMIYAGSRIPSNQKILTRGINPRRLIKAIAELIDKAQNAIVPEGGIDFNKNMNVNTAGDKIDIRFDKAMMGRFRSGDFTGVRPRILGVTFLPSVLPLFGISFATDI